VRETRDERAVLKALAGLDAAARDGSSIVPPTIDAVRVYATVGEISETLRGVFGSYQPDAVI
jgi:methylmalonyl-CoA mutase N-terminal domain/subunit